MIAFPVWSEEIQFAHLVEAFHALQSIEVDTGLGSYRSRMNGEAIHVSPGLPLVRGRWLVSDPLLAAS